MSDGTKYYSLRSNRLTAETWTAGLKEELPNTGWLHKVLIDMENEYESTLEKRDDLSHQTSQSRSMIITPVMVLCLPHSKNTN